MKFIYLTAKGYPASTADHIYILELAKGFNAILKDAFLFIIANASGDDLQGLHTLNLRIRLRRFRTLFYLFWLPYFVLHNRYTKNNIVFFSNDPNLLALLIFWKKFLRFQYQVCSDWHMLFGDWRDGFIARGSDSVVATSRKLKQAIIAISGASESKVLVAYGGIDLERYKPMSIDDARQQLYLPKDKKIVSYIGFFKTMGMEKGIRTMIESLRILPDEVMMLFVGGKDDEIKEYRACAENLRVADRCVFVSRKPQGELAIYEAASDILAIPYPDKPHFRDFGFPMKVYEYMASNRPIIYSKLDLVEEVVAPYARGFSADNPTEFSDAVLEILHNYQSWKEKASQAAVSLKTYTWRQKAQSILDFLKI